MQERVIEEIASVWRNAVTTVVFTGAGMSTESGLPDFRSKQGLWKQRPESLATMAALQQTPDEFFFLLSMAHPTTLVSGTKRGTSGAGAAGEGEQSQSCDYPER